MKRYLTGLASGIIVAAVIVVFIGAQPAADDSIRIYVDRLEQIIRAEIAKNRANGRYQLQSFSIDRTHWHYILDTTTGDLYRVELSRTPENSKWVLVAKGLERDDS